MKEFAVYNLDVETLLQIMQVHQQTGLLQASVPPKIAGIRESRHVEIAVMTGKVTSCTIKYSNGQQITGKEALDSLISVGRLHWNFVPKANTPRQPLQSTQIQSAKSSRFPLRLVPLDQNEVRNWPRLHRLVFAMADGTNSIEKMARMLSISPDVIEVVLEDLQKMQKISRGRIFS
jgi:hypothetical protein